jgi:hypothetical protein
MKAFPLLIKSSFASCGPMNPELATIKTAFANYYLSTLLVKGFQEQHKLLIPLDF